MEQHNFIKYKPGKAAKAFEEAHSWCKAIHDAKFKDDVSKAFAHFDAD